MQKVFICSPYHGDKEKNLELARRFAKFAISEWKIPIIPHMMFATILDDDNRFEREEGIKMGAELLKDCDEMWIIGTKITRGMAYEIAVAEKLQIYVRLRDENGCEISPDTIGIDDRVSQDYIDKVKYLRLKFYIYPSFECHMERMKNRVRRLLNNR
jgi:hypothetical protein